MTTPEQLREAARRARADATELRFFATGLARSHIHELSRLSGDGIWLGPTAAAFQAEVTRSRHDVEAAIDDLHRMAVLRDAEAADLDRAATHAEALAPMVG
jgi:uncharacterized protein YukE